MSGDEAQRRWYLSFVVVGGGFSGVEVAGEITVAATVIALIPLAMHGGPLWVPMCHAQIGGLTVATFVTLVLVPVIYAIVVKDLKLVRWENIERHEEPKGETPVHGEVVHA